NIGFVNAQPRINLATSRGSTDKNNDFRGRCSGGYSRQHSSRKYQTTASSLLRNLAFALDVTLVVIG
ncbi:hypothetical protein, partial [Pseudomonas protegens]|uniref:hypothetical protein n=1 Tax=Pseudomonas protegens TaxID=380021 RepID=UPI001B336D00